MAARRRKRNPDDENLVFINTQGLAGVVINEETGRVTGVPEVANRKRNSKARRNAKPKKKSRPRKAKNARKAKKNARRPRTKNGRFKRVPKSRR